MNRFIQLINDSVISNTFVKLSVVNARDKKAILKNVTVKPIKTKKGEFLSFGYKNKTNYITKNLIHENALVEIQNLLENNFLQATLFTTSADYFMTRYKTGDVKINKKTASITEQPTKNHNRKKERLIETENKTNTVFQAL